MKSPAEIESNLKGKTYAELDRAMADLPSRVLLELMNGKSIKIGDTASSLLGRRNEYALVARTILDGGFTTQLGKIRAANTLSIGKVESSLADEALLKLVQDKNETAAGNALFVLVALRRSGVAEQLEKIRVAPGTTQKVRDRIPVALEALEKGDPRIYSPNYGG